MALDSEGPYNPLEKRNLADSVAGAMLEKEPEPLPPGQSFNGAGIYAIYYVGDFPLYAGIAKRNRERLEAPIYVGKAVSEGARTGGFLDEVAPEPLLFRRLREHARSIEQARNLELVDFFCRYLVVDDIWVPLGESLLISKFAPVWNQVVTGFGIHHPGGGRGNQQKSLWDTLHPGRPWAESLPDNQMAVEEMADRVREHVAKWGQSDDGEDA